MPRKKRQKKNFPPHVIDSNGRWLVRRHFPTAERYANGSPVYMQVVRRCDPHTEERAKEIYDAIGAMRNGEVAEREQDVTVGAFLETYLATKKPSIAIRTHEGDEQLYRLYIKDTPFSRQSLSTVTTMAVQTFYGTLGASGAMVRKVHRLLMSALGLAVVWGKLTSKPKGIILPRQQEAEIEFFTKTDARKFSRFCLSDPQYLVLALALETGARPGEYLGLRWSDINLDKGMLTIRQAISFLRSGGYVIKTPKTRASKRTIRISPQLIAALIAHRERWLDRVRNLKRRSRASISIDHFNARRGVNYKKRKETRANAREYLNQTVSLDLVFSTSNGNPLAAHNLAFREMKEACEKAGVPRRSIYSLRHSCITLLLSDGVDVKTVAERCGTSAAMIWKTYSHVLAESRSGATEKIANTLYL